MIQPDEFGPERILHVYDRKTGMRGILVIDNTALGPGKGGIRMTPTATEEEVFRLARTMTWKNALADLPFGGAKSAIIADPRKITPEEKLAQVRAFSSALKPFTPGEYIAGPDVNTGEEEMAAFADACGTVHACTGKPATLCLHPGKFCGLPHELGSTGFGVAIATLMAAKTAGLGKGARVAIDGFGNVGTFAAKHLSENGMKIIAISDSKGCIHNENGLDICELLEVKKETGSVLNYKDAKTLPKDAVFTLDTDILIPASLTDVINEGNVDSIKAKVIVEGANIPMKLDIENRLARRALIVPDFVANAGGVISSYAEYKGYDPEKMFEIVEEKIRGAMTAVARRAGEKSVTYREAAMEIAIERVRSAMDAQNL